LFFRFRLYNSENANEDETVMVLVCRSAVLGFGPEAGRFPEGREADFIMANMMITGAGSYIPTVKIPTQPSKIVCRGRCEYQRHGLQDGLIFIPSEFRNPADLWLEGRG
jgi:hypothetical protein